jgi:hypothetical protein
MQLRRIIDEKVVVGHNLKEDLESLHLHQVCKFLVRDLSDFDQFKTQAGQSKKLKDLAFEYLNAEI